MTATHTTSISFDDADNRILSVTYRNPSTSTDVAIEVRMSNDADPEAVSIDLLVASTELRRRLADMAGRAIPDRRGWWEET